jgi:DTW domain-containing protein YfiP
LRCPRCALRTCLCAQIPTVATRTEVVIVRHVLERHKHSNSARWAALALPRCRIVDHGGREAPLDPSPLLAPDAWLVYPGATTGPPRPPGAPRTLVFLDGSWAQTRRMLQRIPGLVRLPRLSLPPGPVRRRLRRAPAGGLATLEAVAAALGLVESEEAAAHLHELYALAVDLSFDEPGPTGRRMSESATPPRSGRNDGAQLTRT